MENNKKIKFSEKLSLTFRRKWVVDSTKVFLIVAILIASYIALNLGIKNLDLPEIDVTENKVFTLTDASKKAVSDIENEIKVYAYGFEEDSTLMDFLKQYHEANEKITSEILTEESNYGLVQEYGLESGYQVLVLVSGDSKKVIDSSSFSTYDYTTYQQVDVTEQTVTNSILSLTDVNKPKIYFSTGHNELSIDKDMVSLGLYLNNEAYEYANINILQARSIPEDCSVLAITSPDQDFTDEEVTIIKDYINKGGNIYITMDTVADGTKLPNIQKVLDEYGVTFENGYIMELDEKSALSGYSQIFTPQIAPDHQITMDIYTDSYMWLVYSGRLTWKDAGELTNLGVSKASVLKTSETAAFITDLSKDVNEAIKSAKVEECEIAAVAAKTIKDAEGKDTEVQSKLVISAVGSHATDYKISQLSDTYPLVAFGSNRDFILNSFAFLAEKDNVVTIRKDMANSTYTPTEIQNRIVLTIIFSVPLIIIVSGIIIWRYRKMRK